jgi:hypothetical protein
VLVSEGEGALPTVIKPLQIAAEYQMGEKILRFALFNHKELGF